MINGIAHSYEDVHATVMGMKLAFEEISYDEAEDDPEAVYGQGSRTPIGMGLGPAQLVDITVAMNEDVYQEFAAPAKVAGRSVRDYWPFPITVAYADKEEDGLFIASVENAIHIDTLDKCKVISVSKPNRRGDKVLPRTLKIKGVAVI